MPAPSERSRVRSSLGMTEKPSTVSKILLGNDPRQRTRASQALLVFTVYVVFAVVQHLEVLLGKR
jgi:hypothetical protein